ncbi:MAG: di-heme oxidoredictase family protein [Pseudomonadota bacterium]
MFRSFDFEMTLQPGESTTFLKLALVTLTGCCLMLAYQSYKTFWLPYVPYAEPEIMGYIGKEDPRVLSGGDTTHFHSTSHESFAQEVPNLGWGLSAAFDRGDGFFERPFIPALPDGYASNNDGLGPLYNATTCEACHPADGRGAPPENETALLEEGLIRLSMPGFTRNGHQLTPPGYGPQVSTLATEGIAPEAAVRVKWVEAETGTFPDGEPYSLRKPEILLSNLAYGELPEGTIAEMRMGPQVYGLGLLEAIPTSTMLAWADPEDSDGDGISGRVNRVWDLERGGKVIGKFGWKANSFDVRQQSAEAAFMDMGVNNPLFFGRHDDQSQVYKNTQNCEPEQTACIQAVQGSDFEMTPAQLADVTAYLQLLAVVYRRDIDNPTNLLGEDLFHQANCSACHKSNITTGSHEISRLENQVIHPYTDLLLHDMGEGLSGRPDFEATRTEWRTAPLWGIGKIEQVNGHTNFLHDGRARGLQEAILWHGGEAQASKEFYMNLEKDQRLAILSFLESL